MWIVCVAANGSAVGLVTVSGVIAGAATCCIPAVTEFVRRVSQQTTSNYASSQ